MGLLFDNDEKVLSEIKDLRTTVHDLAEELCSLRQYTFDEWRNVCAENTKIEGLMANLQALVPTDPKSWDLKYSIEQLTKHVDEIRDTFFSLAKAIQEMKNILTSSPPGPPPVDPSSNVPTSPVETVE